MVSLSRPHWLAPGAGAGTPRLLVTFDTETLPTTRDGVEVLTLRCWDARVRVRSGDGAEHDQIMDWEGETPAQLVDVIEAASRIGPEVWVFAHNAGFDLTVTSLPMVLENRGWEAEFVSLGDETCVFILAREGRKLTITDSWSWVRCGLEQVATDVGMRKVKLPADDAELDVWHHRCHHDVVILDRAITQLLDWWDRQQLGRFGVTGSACGWRSMRAHIPEKAILVGPEQPRTALERSAVFGGRKEVWQVGRHRGKYVEDWDLRTAHLTVMAHMPMPLAPAKLSWMTPPPDPIMPPARFQALCEVQVTTEHPCAPVRLDGEVWWPVGTFRTVLTSPELAAVAEVAQDVQILSEQWYRMGDALTPWGQWCAGLQAEPDQLVPRVVKRVAKGWGRAVPGRFALRTSQLVSTRPARHQGWMVEVGHDLDTGEQLEVITYGGVERTYRKDQDGADCSPVVLAFVEGYVRAAILRSLAQRDPGRLLQVNTDGWWEIKHPQSWPTPQDVVPWPFVAARKAVSRDVTVIGPNHTDAGVERRLSGIAKDAARRLDGSYVWQDWPGLRWQLQHSRPGEYVRPGREMVLADHYCRRWVLDSGETVAVSACVDRKGQTRLLPWSGTSQRRPGDRLADWQVPALQALADPDVPWACAAGEPAGPALGRRQQ